MLLTTVTFTFLGNYIFLQSTFMQLRFKVRVRVRVRVRMLKKQKESKRSWASEEGGKLGP